MCNRTESTTANQKKTKEREREKQTIFVTRRLKAIKMSVFPK